MAALRYNDICDIAADAVRCIDARLYGRGLQLEALTGEALRRTLRGCWGWPRWSSSITRGPRSIRTSSTAGRWPDGLRSPPPADP